IKTGSGGLHIYFISDYDTNHVLTNGLGEFRASNYQCVGAGCTHPNGNKYIPLNNNLIQRLSKEEIEEILLPHIRNIGVDNSIPTGKDDSRSSLEYRKIIAELKKGTSRENIYQIMGAYSKWTTATQQYQVMTFEKAEAFVLEEKEKGKSESSEYLRNSRYKICRHKRHKFQHS
ncbi:hypothetical protein LCGC14_2118030, partial [marine sediment metagenome]